MKVGDLVQVNPVIPGLQDFIGIVIEIKNKEYPIIYIVRRTQPNKNYSSPDDDETCAVWVQGLKVISEA